MENIILVGTLDRSGGVSAKFKLRVGILCRFLTIVVLKFRVPVLVIVSNPLEMLSLLVSSHCIPNMFWDSLMFLVALVLDMIGIALVAIVVVVLPIGFVVFDMVGIPLAVVALVFVLIHHVVFVQKPLQTLLIAIT